MTFTGRAADLIRNDGRHHQTGELRDTLVFVRWPEPEPSHLV
ncbi:MAG: hypothetical protein R3248_12825 [Candidatus Promineifilaceae bacterium]|nr:hypothetical protein [Candidatus Promineifilaceae bacterium]